MVACASVVLAKQCMHVVYLMHDCCIVGEGSGLNWPEPYPIVVSTVYAARA